MTADEQMKKVKEEEITFSSVFNQTMVTILDGLLAGGDKYTSEGPALDFYHASVSRLYDDLSKKRAFGEKKYGDRSFQASLENLLTCPVEKHLEEEVIDAINYVLALIYINGIIWDEDRKELYEDIAEDLLGVYMKLRYNEKK